MNLNSLCWFGSRHEWVVYVLDEVLRNLRLLVNSALTELGLNVSFILNTYHRFLCGLGRLSVFWLMHSIVICCFWDTTVTCIFYSSQLHFLDCVDSVLKDRFLIFYSDVLVCQSWRERVFRVISLFFLSRFLNEILIH